MRPFGDQARRANNATQRGDGSGNESPTTSKSSLLSAFNQARRKVRKWNGRVRTTLRGDKRPLASVRGRSSSMVSVRSFPRVGFNPICFFDGPTAHTHTTNVAGGKNSQKDPVPSAEGEASTGQAHPGAWLLHRWEDKNNGIDGVDASCQGRSSPGLVCVRFSVFS